MKASIISSLAIGAATVSAASNYTVSTVYTTSVYTITSCAPTVTDCPAKMGSVTTDIISLYTTICPVTQSKYEYQTMPAQPYPTQMTTSTIYSTVEYTITACPPSVTNCPVGSKTSSVITSTTVCPVSTPVYPPVTYTTLPPPVKTESATVIPPVNTVSLSTITYSTCVPTTYISVITVYPSATVVPVCPGGVNCPVVTKSYGTAAPSGTAPAKNGTQTYVPVTGAGVAKQAGGLMMAVGVAAALFM